MRRERVRQALLAAWLVVVAVVTLAPTGGPVRSVSTCLVCGEFGTSELLLNVLLFVPLGVLLAARGELRDVPRGATLDDPLRLREAYGMAGVLAVGASLSLGIEALQWIAVPGRVTALGDWLANSAGGVVGWLLFRMRAQLLSPLGPTGRAIVLGWTGFACAALAFGWWSSEPWLPDGTWYLQRAPVRPWSTPHTGALLFAGIGDVDLPSDRIGDASLVAGVRDGTQPVAIEERVGAPPERLSYAVRLVESTRGHELLAVGRVRDDVVLQRLTNAARVRVASVGVRGGDAYARLAGRTMRWEVRPATGMVRTAPPIPGVRFAARSTLRGWTALLPRTVALRAPWIGVIDGLWGLGLVAPIGWWVGGAWRRSR